MFIFLQASIPESDYCLGHTCNFKI